SEDRHADEHANEDQCPLGLELHGTTLPLPYGEDVDCGYAAVRPLDREAGETIRTRGRSCRSDLPRRPRRILSPEKSPLRRASLSGYEPNMLRSREPVHLKRGRTPRSEERRVGKGG